MGGYSAVPGGRDAALGRVKGPAIAIMVIAALGILGCLASLVMNLFMGGMGALGGGSSDKVGAMLSGGIGIASAGLGIIVYAVALFGAMKMSKLESYAMAWVGTICVALPCGPCCCIFGFPIAIWSAIVLLNDEVKSAFGG